MSEQTALDQAVAKLEEAAKGLNDANDVEACWFLRGVGAGLAGEDLESCPGYQGHYNRGFRAGRKQRDV